MILITHTDFVYYCRNGEHSLPNSYVYLLIPGMGRLLCLVNDIDHDLCFAHWRSIISNPCNLKFDLPGLFSNHGPLYFVETKRFFSKMGLACHIAKIHSEVLNEDSNNCRLRVPK